MFWKNGLWELKGSESWAEVACGLLLRCVSFQLNLNYRTAPKSFAIY